jgi:hypothetical protein
MDCFSNWKYSSMFVGFFMMINFFFSYFPVYPCISLYNRAHLSHVQTCFSFLLCIHLGWFLLFFSYMKYTAKEKEQ